MCYNIIKESHPKKEEKKRPWVSQATMKLSPSLCNVYSEEQMREALGGFDGEISLVA